MKENGRSQRGAREHGKNRLRKAIGASTIAAGALVLHATGAEATPADTAAQATAAVNNAMSAISGSARTEAPVAAAPVASTPVVTRSEASTPVVLTRTAPAAEAPVAPVVVDTSNAPSIQAQAVSIDNAVSQEARQQWQAQTGVQDIETPSAAPIPSVPAPVAAAPSVDPNYASAVQRDAVSINNNVAANAMKSWEDTTGVPALEAPVASAPVVTTRVETPEPVASAPFVTAEPVASAPVVLDTQAPAARVDVPVPNSTAVQTMQTLEAAGQEAYNAAAAAGLQDTVGPVLQGVHADAANALGVPNINYSDGSNSQHNGDYNNDGYNKDGYDKDGYNHDGVNKDGYDREGNLCVPPPPPPPVDCEVPPVVYPPTPPSHEVPPPVVTPPPPVVIVKPPHVVTPPTKIIVPAPVFVSQTQTQIVQVEQIVNVAPAPTPAPAQVENIVYVPVPKVKYAAAPQADFAPQAQVAAPETTGKLALTGSPVAIETGAAVAFAALGGATLAAERKSRRKAERTVSKVLVSA